MTLKDASNDRELDDSALAELIEQRCIALIAACQIRELMMATAESRTGGLISGALIGVAGASAVVERGVVAYSNTAKMGLLDVPPALLAQFGAVSEEAARAMAEGMLAGTAAAEANRKLGLTLSVTGIAGPGGGSEEKPEGLVHFAAALKGAMTLHAEERFGAPGRNRVRQLSVARALALGLEAIAPN